jgi:hypothetical protein
MLERNRLVTVEVERLLAATKGSRNAARYIRPNPAPPHRTPQRSMLGLSQQTAGKPHLDNEHQRSRTRRRYQPQDFAASHPNRSIIGHS